MIDGEYILKIDKVRDFKIYNDSRDNCEIEVLHWGKIEEKNEENQILLHNVSKVYEPEPDKIPIEYWNSKFVEIPEWLFSKKVSSKTMSGFYYDDTITNIPENLFKNCINAENFYSTFIGCINITSIPENLFINNTEIKNLINTFNGCEGINRIPSKLLNNNNKVINVSRMFEDCKNLETIPIEIINKVMSGSIDYEGMFYGCTKADNYNNLVEKFKKPY